MTDNHSDCDVQCARCGSSMTTETCDQCSGEGHRGHDCGEDCCSCADPEDNVPCEFCDGRGFWTMCLSSAEFCHLNPLKGRESVERHTPEFFKIDVDDHSNCECTGADPYGLLGDEVWGTGTPEGEP